ncbi:hypothetical protein MAPG_03920 [Magnaporthiopsis poae ATCC 64411]|uniref:Uncharacterized protein n=1 Tax=Magnaporthiopsis poae (strain ATCC 64411 / 73-15) TaxID=644358 RepID=A0A0C4DVB8_MAGP6|nr:hypothetical protein MAPG_03920 [Magnaporthiopsis poae ATCC 64411]
MAAVATPRRGLAGESGRDIECVRGCSEQTRQGKIKIKERRAADGGTRHRVLAATGPQGYTQRPSATHNLCVACHFPLSRAVTGSHPSERHGLAVARQERASAIVFRPD